jgi:hypothetical protein
MQWQPTAASAFDEPPCGVDQTIDWVCPLQGVVVAKRRQLYSPGTFPILNRRLITGRGSAARLAFRDQATCTLGESSVIFPRKGMADTLFTQKRGSASCSSVRTANIGILCGRVERCPAELRGDGDFLYKSLRPRGAQASGARVIRRRIEVVSCDGFIEVLVRTRNGLSRASGSGSPGHRVRIVVDVISKVVRTRFGVSIYSYGSSRTIGEAGTPAAEECEASFAQRSEDTFTP